MLESLMHWPAWYLLLIAHTVVLAVSALRTQGRVAAALRQTETTVIDAQERGRLAGQRAAGWTRASGWLIAVLLLGTGSVWALTLVAAGYFLSARQAYRDFAQGFAEGRKSVELASAHEYVQGRVPPRTADYLAAGLVVGVTRILPLAATLVAMTWLPR